MVGFVDRLHKMSTARAILLGQPHMEKELQSVALYAETQGTGYDLSFECCKYLCYIFARAYCFRFGKRLATMCDCESIPSSFRGDFR